MNQQKAKDEFLEELWYMRERGEQGIDVLRKALGDEFDSDVFDELHDEKICTIDMKNGTVALTALGEDKARKVIRAHRLAERLLRDVLQGEFEQGACEFEHTINPELVDGICTLLGHPRLCPHGKPIPEGECCKRITPEVQTFVRPLCELDVGQGGRIAYVQCENDKQMHRMDGLQIRPGAQVKLHQKYPTFVIECEGMSIALDREIAENIRVWAQNVAYGPPFEPETRSFFRGFGFRRASHRRKD